MNTRRLPAFVLVALLCIHVPAAAQFVTIETLSYKETGLEQVEWTFRFHQPGGPVDNPLLAPFTLLTQNDCSTEVNWCGRARFEQVSGLEKLQIKLDLQFSHFRDPHNGNFDEGGRASFSIPDVKGLEASAGGTLLFSTFVEHTDSLGAHSDSHDLSYTGGGGSEKIVDFTWLGLHHPHAPIPEPSTLVLLGSGALALASGAWRRRRRRR